MDINKGDGDAEKKAVVNAHAPMACGVYRLRGLVSFNMSPWWDIPPPPPPLTSVEILLLP